MPFDLPPQVLIVDDDPLFLAGQVRLHCAAGVEWELRVLTRSQDAVAVLSRENPQVMITDILMPEVEGLELIQMAQSLSPQTQIIAISGGSSVAQVDSLDIAKMLGACAVIPKPFEPETLFRAIRDALAHHAGRADSAE